MKDNEKISSSDKEELKKIVAEVKAIVGSIIHLPAEKKVSLGALGLLNVR